MYHGCGSPSEVDPLQEDNGEVLMLKQENVFESNRVLFMRDVCEPETVRLVVLWDI